MAIKGIFKKLDGDILDLIKGGGATFFIRIIGILLLYLFTIAITNNWGADVYGEFTFFVLSLKLIAIISTAGLDIYLLRYISDSPKETKIGRLVGNGTVAILLNSIIIGIIIYFLGRIYFETFFSQFWYVSMLILGILPFSITKINAQLFRAQKNASMYSFIEFSGIPFFAIIYFYILKQFNYDSNNIPVLAYTLGIITVFIISIFKWQLKYGIEIIQNLTHHFKQFTTTNKLALPFLIAGSSIYFGQWAVSLILKYFEGDAALGNFDAAFRIGYLLMMPLFASTTIAAPIFSRKFTTNDNKGIEKILKLTTNVVFFITTPMMIIAYLFSDQIMAFYGPDFEQSGGILKIILIGFFFNTLTGPISVLLQMAEKQVLVQNVFLISTIFNVLMCYFLIPKYGIIGACWSNVIYQIIINGYLLIYLKVKFGYLSFGK